MNKPLVSVHMVTYNHEAFIAQAIEGVLMQKCNFEIELIIADDCSPDHTEKIVHSFSNHPNYHWIKYTKHSVNKGMVENSLWIYEQIKGKYVATCEGDDYWTDPCKLQKQIDFLENNTQYSACFHKVYFKHLDAKKDSVSNHNLGSDMDFHFEDFIAENPASTCSVVYRSSIILSNKKHLAFKPVIDDFTILLLAKAGKIRFINEIMGTYRIHPGGVASMREEITGLKLIISYRKAILNYFRSENEILISQFYRVIGNLYKRLAIAYLKKTGYFKFFSCYIAAGYYIYKGGGNIYPEIIYSAKSHLIRRLNHDRVH